MALMRSNGPKTAVRHLPGFLCAHVHVHVHANVEVEVHVHVLHRSRAILVLLYCTYTPLSYTFIQVQKPAMKWEIAIISELHTRLYVSNLMFGVSHNYI